MPDLLASLSPEQQARVSGWLPGAQVVCDHSWGLVGTTVLEVESGRRRYVVKAERGAHHHLAREINAHERWLHRWVEAGRAPRLVASDLDARVLVTEYLPGTLVLGAPAQERPDTFRQAGELLAVLHDQPGRPGPDYEADQNAKVLANLDKAHRIAPDTAGRLNEIVRRWVPQPVVVVPTHGDWQPRNWLVHQGRVSAIDFGRATMRPALTDWVRLEARDFRADPRREAAFVEGYGSDPRTGPAWLRERVREAINTAVWAHAVGDERFEAQGHEMIERVLSECG